MAYYECECDNFDMTEGQDSFEMNEGIPGPGVPAGGSAGQVLRKTTSADYDTEWDTLDAGEIPYSGSTSYPNNTVGSKVYELDSGVNSLWNYAVQANTKASNALDNEATAYNYHLQYHVGDYCLYQQKLYRCIVETPAAGEMWNSSHWTAVTVGDEMIETASDISVLRNTLNHKADVIYDTASGDIASFPDGADGLPVKDLTVGIEPVQDLHGYSNPWPAGGGKNMLNVTVSSSTVYGVTYTVNTDGTVTVNGTADANNNSVLIIGSVTLVSGTQYILSGCPSGGSATTFELMLTAESSGGASKARDTGTGATYTETENHTRAIQIVVRAGQTVSNITFKPMLRLSSVSDATFAPYSNICPISGWMGANVTRTGKNLAYSKLNNKSITGNGVIDDSGNTNDLCLARVIKGVTYVISDNEPTTHVYAFFENEPAQGSVSYNNSRYVVVNNSSFVAPITGYVAFRVPINYGYGQLELGSTATAYEPYSGTTIPISWQSSAGTVYGGTLDVTSGVLTVDRAYVDLGTLTWEKAAENTVFRTTLAGAKTGLPNTICDKRKMVYTQRFNLTSPYELAPYNAVNIYICSLVGEYTTATAFKAAMSGCHVCYELAQPTSVTLTATEVLTLLGQNNVWADCGPVSVEYPCDTKLYIQKINTPTDDDMIADANIASGQYFIVNNNLYISTAAILAGDPIKPGTNCTLTNLAAALNALNS